MKAGFPPSQISLGVASYGHSFHVNRTDAINNITGDLNPYPLFDKSLQPAGDKWDSTATGTDVCGIPNVVGGIYNFWGLIDAGFLLSDGALANGIYYRFDNCARTVRALPHS
jgi:chitinase